MTVPSKVKVAQSCLILYNHMDCSLPGSSVHEILQARILEWVAISFSSNSSKTLSKDQGVHSGPIPANLHRFPKMGFPGGSDKRIHLQCGRPGFHSWFGKSPWRRNSYPLQYSGLENSMARGARQATYSPKNRT
ncbi:unnamed protein product [Rangifer tarandus platyrhynchus]|uniref:Uncharacterized protein n=1 Tax=Rangifer tarandus platyrhynchus TaxID=3082113 RepID=A0AC59YX96_RANTA